MELMTKNYKEATRELDETAFQLAITNEELKRKEKELEERLAEVMALRSLQRQRRDPQEKLTCLLTAVRNWLWICQETVTQNEMRHQGADLGVVRRTYVGRYHTSLSLSDISISKRRKLGFSRCYPIVSILQVQGE